jgi:DNA-binding transcriptional MerR regulator
MATTNERAVDYGFSGAKAAEIVGISYRQLDYWARTDLVRPTVTDAAGSGSRRRYGYTDLLELKVIKSLLDAGIRLENVREIFSYLRDILGQEITSANLVIQGSTSVVIQSDGELIDLIHKGQGVLNILPLAGVRDEMDARIREMRPAEVSSEAVAEVPTAASQQAI